MRDFLHKIAQKIIVTAIAACDTMKINNICYCQYLLFSLFVVHSIMLGGNNYAD